MPIDPTIPLSGLATTSPQSMQPQGGNPLGMLSSVAGTMNELNQNRLFQQTFAARQLAGQIMATSPDENTGLQRIMQSPAAPFVGDFVNQSRASMLALLQAQRESQGMSVDGIQAAFKVILPSVMADPTTWDSAVGIGLAPLSPIARSAAIPAINSLREALVGGLSEDPKMARMQVNQRISGMMQAVGLGPDAIKAIVGTPYQLGMGGSTRFGVQGPPQLGGAPSEAGSLPMTLPPSLQSFTGPGGQPFSAIVRDPNAGGGGTEIVGSENGLGAGGKTAAGANPFIGPTVTARTTMEGRAKVAGQIAEEMDDISKNLPGQVKKLDMMTDALQHFQSGGGTDIRADLAMFVQAMRNSGLLPNISQETIDKIGAGGLAAQQVFTSEVKPTVIAELKSAAQGTGRVMASEVNAFLEMMDSDKDPKALMQMLNQGRYMAQISFDQANHYVQFKQGLDNGTITGYGPEDFHTWYNNQPSRLPARSPSGMQLAPVPISNALGVSQEVSGHVYKSGDEVNKAYQEGAFGPPKTRKAYDAAHAELKKLGYQ